MATKAKIMMTAAGLLFAVTVVPVHASTYYYTGVTKTPNNQYVAEATISMAKIPSCYGCHLASWVIVWDKGRTGEFVEAGLGYRPVGRCEGQTPVMLWYATKKDPTGITVGCVPRNTKVTVHINKIHGTEEAYVRWGYDRTTIERVITLPRWRTTGGIAPCKVEIWSRYGNQPKPVDVTVQRTKGWGGRLQETAPYMLVQPSDVNGFRVRYE